MFKGMATVNQATNDKAETSRQNIHQVTVPLVIYLEPLTNIAREVREVMLKPERMCQGWATLNDLECSSLRHMAIWREQKRVRTSATRQREYA